MSARAAAACMALALVALVIVTAITGLERARAPHVIVCDCPSVVNLGVPFRGSFGL